MPEEVGGGGAGSTGCPRCAVDLGLGMPVSGFTLKVSCIACRGGSVDVVCWKDKTNCINDEGTNDGDCKSQSYITIYINQIVNETTRKMFNERNEWIVSCLLNGQKNRIHRKRKARNILFETCYL